MSEIKKQVKDVATGKFLDEARLASLLTVLTYATAIYMLAANKIVVDTPEDFLKFFGGLAAITVGNAALGEVRNRAKKGTHG